MVGRDSTTINSGGEKIFAEKSAMKTHPAVFDALCSRPSTRWVKKCAQSCSCERQSPGVIEAAARPRGAQLARLAATSCSASAQHQPERQARLRLSAP